MIIFFFSEKRYKDFDELCFMNYKRKITYFFGLPQIVRFSFFVSISRASSFEEETSSSFSLGESCFLLTETRDIEMTI